MRRPSKHLPHHTCNTYLSEHLLLFADFVLYTGDTEMVETTLPSKSSLPSKKRRGDRQ